MIYMNTHILHIYCLLPYQKMSFMAELSMESFEVDACVHAYHHYK